MKLFRIFKREKKKRWLDFKEVSERLAQRTRVLGNSSDCKESNRNLWKNYTDHFGIFLRNGE